MPKLWIYHYGHAKGKEFHEMKKKFYETELEKFKLEDGTSASDKFDEKFVEFMEETEDLNTILHYGGAHSAALSSHPQRYRACGHQKYWKPHNDSVDGSLQFTANKEIKDWQENFVYGAKELPNIALLMMGEWKKTEPFYNSLEADCAD